ncbi:MAG: hypothetical protein JXB03_08765 [Spirochaetales bacterium]|nr:hypothetical protein [Spirochaetales bacterium]
MSDLYTTVGAMPLHPLPGHSGYLVPSVDDIVRLLAPVPYDTASKILICGPMAGYVGLVAGAAGFPVLIIEFGGRERGYVLEYTGANPDQLVQVAPGRNLETFKEQGPFDVIIVTYGTQTMPAALLDQLSSESGIMILPLSDAFGSQLLTVIVKTESGFDLSVKGRTNLSFVNTAGQR